MSLNSTEPTEIESEKLWYVTIPTILLALGPIYLATCGFFIYLAVKHYKDIYGVRRNVDDEVEISPMPVEMGIQTSNDEIQLGRVESAVTTAAGVRQTTESNISLNSQDSQNQTAIEMTDISSNSLTEEEISNEDVGAGPIGIEMGVQLTDEEDPLTEVECTGSTTAGMRQSVERFTYLRHQDSRNWAFIEMPGTASNSLTEEEISDAIHFWRPLDDNYARLHRVYIHRQIKDT